MAKLEPSKILVVTLDGATWTVLNDVIDCGKMPTLQSLRETGSSGTLKTVVPPGTATAWSSFHTGVTPGQHGVFSFYGSGWPPRSEVSNSSDIELPTLWERLDDGDKRPLLIDLPMTYPPFDVEGIAVGGIGNPLVERLYAHPDEDVLHDWQADDFPLAQQDIYELVDDHEPRQTVEGLASYTDLFEESVATKAAFAEELLSAHHWTVAVVHFAETDLFQHSVWPSLDRGHDAFEEERFDIATELYRAVDEAIERLCVSSEVVPDDVTVLLLSDHGHQPIQHTVYPNHYLRQHGLYNEPSPSKPASLIRRLVGKVPTPVKDIARSVSFLANAYHRTVTDVNQTAIQEGSRYYVLNCCNYGQVFCFDDVTADEVVDDFAGLVDPETGRSVIDSITPASEQFDRITVDTYPEYFIRMKDGYFVHPSSDADAAVSAHDPEDSWAMSTHREDGMYALAGPQVSNTDRDANLIDLTPTILAHVGLGIPRHMDGDPLVGLFDEQWRTDRDVEFVDAVQSRNRTEYETTTDDEQKIRGRLAALGYVDEDESE